MKSLLSSRPSILLTAVCCSILITSCETENPVITFIDHGEIGSQGGIVKTNDGASINIPEGALKSNIAVSITRVSNEEVFLNESCRIYSFEPSGIVFSDSVIITLPFDATFLNKTSPEADFGINVIAFQDSTWVRLKAKINLDNNTASIKTLHFSFYAIESPSMYSDLYFSSIGWAGSKRVVPYYFQEGGWCAFYSVSMITKFAGYDHKGPFYAKLMGKGSPDALLVLIYESTVDKMKERLKNKGIETEVKHWNSISNLCGYIMYNFNYYERPVAVFSRTIHHAFVVSGYDATGFFINDPSNAFLRRINPSIKLTKLSMYHVTYDQFIRILNPINDTSSESTMVVLSSGNSNKLPFTINFKKMLVDDKTYNIAVNRVNADGSNIIVGELDINGKYEPAGYSLINTLNPGKGFNGNDFLHVRPYLSCSFNGTMRHYAELFLKIDGRDVFGGPRWIEFIDTPLSNFLVSPLTVQLTNLSKGTHKIEVELKMEGGYELLDKWDFDLNIENESSDKLFNPNLTYGSVVDIEGNIYKTIRIGNQTWLAENLKTTKYNDGTSIRHETDNNTWSELNIPAYCWYMNDPYNKNIFGALYNWHAVKQSNLCPVGWHVPSDADWETLVIELKGEGIAGAKMKEIGTSHWIATTEDVTNESGFTALPGGDRSGKIVGGEFFCSPGQVGRWWSSTQFNETDAWLRYIDYCDIKLIRSYTSKEHGFSVRCIKN